jgi:hypothetical protein
VSFFELPPPPPEPPDEHVQPAWIGPPDNVLGAAFPLVVPLARTADVALQVHTGLAYPSGIEFSLQLVQREWPRDRFRGGPIHDWHRGRREGGLEADVLRFGIELADGRKATVFDPHPFSDDGEPVGPVLTQRGGGGGERRYDVRFWLWPLPPPAQLSFVVEWPGQGIELTKHAIDTSELLEAAARAEELWPGGPSASGGGSIWTRQVAVARKTEPSK